MWASARPCSHDGHEGYTVSISRTIRSAALISLLAICFAGGALAQQPQHAKAGSVLADRVGDFAATERAVSEEFERFEPGDYGIVEAFSRLYAGPNNSKLKATVVKTRSNSAAYSLMRRLAREGRSTPVVSLQGFGLIGTDEPNRLSFIKGDRLVEVEADSAGGASLRALAGSLAEKIDGVEGDIPVLVLHLPEWERKIRDDVGFAVTLSALQHFAGQRPALEVVSFDGGAEAATAEYEGARLVIVEFTTPQHSVDNDARINERIAQLRASNGPVPSLYRRVGNYSVFVFDAPSEAAAERLASGVKYEKDVRWLGRSPNADEIVARHYTQTMGGAIIAALIITGFSILLCLAVGGLLGGAVFLYRRTKLTEHQVFSDAGGMMRLNLEDLHSSAAGATPKLMARPEE